VELEGTLSQVMSLLILSEIILLADQEIYMLLDFYIGYIADDIHIIMTHTRGKDDVDVLKLAWGSFREGTKVAKEQGLYGADQDLLKDAFSDNVKGMGTRYC
jgi:fructose 1,6-bisphosphate aldolase/phosphatase